MEFHARWLQTRSASEMTYIVSSGALNSTHSPARNTRCDIRKCLFGVHTMADNILGVQIPQKPSKMAIYKHVRASANGLKTNDVIED